MPTFPIPSRLERLIAHDTTSSRSNRALIDEVAGWLDRPGVEIEIIAAPDNKATLIARQGPEVSSTRAGLVLCGHTDVVPALESTWHSDPFILTRRGDELFGRGTADMKGFLALAIDAFLRVDPDQLEAPLALLFTHDEEIGTLGARFLVEHHASSLARLPVATIIGEPTELKAVRLHKGHLKMRIEIEGESAHSAYPHLGHNAIEPLGELIRALVAKRRLLERDSPSLPSSRFFPEVPFAALNLAKVEGGVAVNVVPDHAALELGMRLLPGMEPEAEAAALETIAIEALAGERVRVEVLSTSPPLEVDRNTRLHTRLRSLLAQTSEDESVSFATDAGWLQRLGFECVLWGPGSIRVAHKPNEHVTIADLAAAAPVLEAIINTYCLGKELS